MNETKEEIRNKFIQNGIPYDDIDPEMIGLLDVLNFKWGLKTKFCCYGHSLDEPAYVMFDEDVKDEEIYKLVEFLHSEFPKNQDIYKQTKIYKLARTKPVLLNWVLQIVPYSAHRKTEELKRENFELVVNYLKRLKL